MLSSNNRSFSGTGECGVFSLTSINDNFPLVRWVFPRLSLLVFNFPPKPMQPCRITTIMLALRASSLYPPCLKYFCVLPLIAGVDPRASGLQFLTIGVTHGLASSIIEGLDIFI